MQDALWGSARSDIGKLKMLNAKIALTQNLFRSFSYDVMPQWISFTISCFCNLRCPHCQTHGTEEARRVFNSKVWSDELTRRLTSEALPFAYECSLSLNGEPLATPSLRRRLAELDRYGVRLHLTTNGTLLSKEMLARVLPLVSVLGISVDGATQRTIEAIRLGSSFEKLIHNIKVLTRATELYDWRGSPPEVSIAATIMASNVTEMPEIVFLAHSLGVRKVDFFEVVAHFPHVKDEVLSLHAPLYNAYREQTLEVAGSLGVRVSMPGAFPGVAGDAHAQRRGTSVILGQQPNGRVDGVPQPELQVDQEKVEADASDVVSLMIDQARSGRTSAGAEDQIKVQLTRMEGAYEDLCCRFRHELRVLSDGVTPYCVYLFGRTFIDSERDVAPCCVPGRPAFGNVNSATVREIYNGELYNEFRAGFLSSDPPSCCAGCRFRVLLENRSIIKMIE